MLLQPVKLQKIIFFLFAITTSLFGNAQMETGHFKYEFKYEALTQEALETVGLMPKLSYDIYFSPKQTAVYLDMGIFMKMKIATDIKSGKVLLTKNAGSSFKALKTTSEELEAYHKETDDNNTETDQEENNVKLVSGTKVIKGYTCKKAEMTDKDGHVITYWYTEKIKIKGLTGTQFDANIPGTILGFEFETADIISICEVTLVEKNIEDMSVFDMNIPDGYEEVENIDAFFENE